MQSLLAGTMNRRHMKFFINQQFAVN